jgi:hypothetical protein
MIGDAARPFVRRPAAQASGLRVALSEPIEGTRCGIHDGDVPVVGTHPQLR